MLGEDNTLLTRAGVDQIVEKQRANDMMKLKIINLCDDDDGVDSTGPLCLLWDLAEGALPVTATGVFTMTSCNLDGREINDGESESKMRESMQGFVSNRMLNAFHSLCAFSILLWESYRLSATITGLLKLGGDKYVKSWIVSTVSELSANGIRTYNM